MAAVGSHTMKPELSEILDAIIQKHGDIARDCVLKCEDMHVLILEKIANVVRELKSCYKHDQFSVGTLGTWYNVVNDAERVKIDVAWLREAIDHVSHLVFSRRTSSVFKDVVDTMIKLRKEERARLDLEIESKKAELAEVLSEIESKKVELLKLGSQMYLEQLLV